MIFVTTYVIEIPVGTKAVLHIGDSMVFAAVILLGKRKAAIAAALGMALFDVSTPYIIWAPFTFVIKGLMAYIAGAVAFRSGFNGEKLWNNILGFALGGIWMIIGYLFAGRILYGSFAAALLDVQWNVLQVVLGIVIAVPLIKTLKSLKVLRR
jgi:uncharacterized membrane protein